MATSDTLEVLRTSDLFAGIPDQDLRKFTEYLDQEVFAPGEIIINEGESGDRLYLMVEGTASVEKKVLAKDGISFETIATLKAGETFGEMELVDKHPRSATVRARDSVQVLSLPSISIHQATGEDLRAFSIILLNLAREISLRLRETDSWLAGSLFSIRKNR
ncbi:cyclic nucleotide-binding domain-containing protein [Rubellicoccus peritrichatus]|uniref:Cyclic nucleotide-binding domain-containing protein n=1 Tax=Rubellicoccus peritrichatus TaxID=3080537 RepID=A0AAQ3LES0_9BACT|nr:cyclic nucleotide-binding domain-containing protein [Puniceicoccus sp. CR14]WOO42298.1 cyclic nucleotide-binding domain-containing protein [Puniceicoccus sp. CR14]